MDPSRLNFRIDARATGSRARAGTFRTLHNEVSTPLFMPVGTQGTVKAQLPGMLVDSGSQILLANTYHLLLRPGAEVFRKFGGIHEFMTWERSVLTDSGGFQIFSLPHSRSMGEEGAVFQSYVDGTSILLSPELSIETQKAINSDIMMVLDQCIASTAGAPEATRALEITTRWARRSLEARGDSPQSLFAIVQGALFPNLRRQSAEQLMEMSFDGFAIGGLAVGEEKSQREDICEFTAGLLPPDRPRYLMGVGTPVDLLEAIHRGVDMFDCIIPTQLARRGTVFTSRGYVQLRRSVYKLSDEKLDPDCGCPVCARYPVGYLHHLHKAREALSWTLLGQHNIHFYHQLMDDVRQSIKEDRFLQLYEQKRAVLGNEDPDFPSRQPSRIRVKAEPPLVLGDYEVHIATAGFASIRQRSSGEIMHSHTPPMEEAHSLYVAQSDLANLLSGTLDDAPLVIWDVGLGAAANAMAAIHCYEAGAAAGAVRPLHIISFENDLDSLRLALSHDRKFEYLRHAGPRGLLARAAWHPKRLPGMKWTLMEGDFLQNLQHAPSPPDLVFYDMFSFLSEPRHWTLDVFRSIAGVCQGRETELFTYSTSTAVRAGLLVAGFHVAKGRGTGAKSETTVALTPRAAAHAPGRRHVLLDAEWLARWKRSHTAVPDGLSAEAREAFSRAVLTHPQFQ